MATNQGQAEPLLHVVVDEYAVVQHQDGRVEILRHGQPWIYRVEAGVKAVIALAYEVEELRKAAATQKKARAR